LPLNPVTREFLALVERETGYPAKLVEEPELPTLARVQIARGNVLAQFTQSGTTRSIGLDYMIDYRDIGP